MPNKKQYKPSEVLQILGNGLYEIRTAAKSPQSMYTTDFATVDGKIKKLDDGKTNIYFTLNMINPALHSRPQSEKFVSSYQVTKLNTTQDTEIISYRWLLVDFDPVRPTDVASSEEERQKALVKTREVFKALMDAGVQQNSMIVADSGNGYHILIRVDFENNDANKETVKNFLGSLDFIFSDEFIQVDVKNFNPSRITKMYGTYSRKGMDTAERPHRLSNLMVVPEEITVCPLETIQRIAQPAVERQKQKNTRPTHSSSNGNFDANQFLDEFIAKHNIRVTSDTVVGGVRRMKLETCPFNSAHGHDAMIGVADNKPFFSCFHNGCSDNHWREFRLLYEPNFEREREEKQAEFEAKKNNVQQPVQYQQKPNRVNVMDVVTEISKKSDMVKAVQKVANPIDETKEWFTLQDGLEALNCDDEHDVGFPTGFANLDEYLQDGILAKGTFTIISGDNSSGKSTFINQLVLNLANTGHKSLVYSGELVIKRFTKWMLRQACGSENMAISQKGNTYVPDDIANQIAKWSKDKIFLYNNKRSQKVTDIIRTIIKCIEQEKVEFVVIDNLMSMETDELGKDYGVDKQIIQASIKVAQDYNVHIVLIAHPRKTNGYLRKDDICGEKNIANLADNIFIMHRNNSDFKRAYYEYKTGKKWVEGCKEEFLGYGNILEICKNRDNGSAIDKKVPFYFDIESKRFLVEANEKVNYGWQKGFMEYKEIEQAEDLPY